MWLCGTAIPTNNWFCVKKRCSFGGSGPVAQGIAFSAKKNIDLAVHCRPLPTETACDVVELIDVSFAWKQRLSTQAFCKKAPDCPNVDGRPVRRVADLQ